MPSVWTKGNYKRLSVERDLLQWCGWKQWQTFLRAIPNPLTRDVIATEFSVMGRVTEALTAHTKMFKIKADHILVSGLALEKRWRKISVQLQCRECNFVNEPRAVQCAGCGANLLVLGKKHYVTEKLNTVRIPFWFPIKEPQTTYLIDRINTHDGLLFPELNIEGQHRENGRKIAYTLMRQIDPLAKEYLGVPHCWNHLFVAERGHCLGEEYDMDELEIKSFSSRVKSETVSKYVKKRLSYRRKMGL